MSNEERLRFLQGAVFVAGLHTLGHDSGEVHERLKDIAMGWSIDDRQLIDTPDEMVQEIVAATRHTQLIMFGEWPRRDR